MRAMVLEKQGQKLIAKQVPPPQYSPHEIFIKVSACAICRTDLHVVDGELTKTKTSL